MKLGEALLVEGDARLRDAMGESLRRAGFARIAAYACPDEAMEHFVRARPAAAFIGVVGEADARAALCAEMLALDARVPVVGLSREEDDAETDDRFVRTVLRAGAFAVVPREPGALLRVSREIEREVELAALA